MAELEKKLKKAIENDKSSSLLENLSKVSCLIIDEVGHCDPLKERESNLFSKSLTKGMISAKAQPCSPAT